MHLFVFGQSTYAEYILRKFVMVSMLLKVMRKIGGSIPVLAKTKEGN
jgi:hypothetical protein